MARASLWAGIVCPGLALDAVTRLLPDTDNGQVARAVHQPVGGRTRIAIANRAAARLGVRPDQALADALAIAPGLDSRPRDRRAEQQLLEEIALIAYQYSGQVAIAGNGVVLEVGGSRRLHGALDTLLESLAAELSRLGATIRLGTAPVPAAACLLALGRRHAHDPQTLKKLLADWPLDRLALSPAERGKLAGLGLRRICDVLRLPRFERDRRLGRAIGRYLDEIHGLESTPLVYWQPPETFERRIELPVPTIHTEALLFVLNRVLEHLGQWLRIRDHSLTGLEVTMQPENQGPATVVTAGLGQPGFRRERLLDILRLKFDPLKPGSAIESLHVRAESIAGQRPPQADLWTGTNVNDAWPALLDRLTARIGEDGLCGLAPCPDHRPEKAWTWTRPGTTSTVSESPVRPNWLLPEPRPCRSEDLRLIDGPERIEAGWWDGNDCRRDYWVAHDRHGNRLWVFHEYKPREGWFLHGLFG